VLYNPLQTTNCNPRTGATTIPNTSTGPATRPRLLSEQPNGVSMCSRVMESTFSLSLLWSSERGILTRRHVRLGRLRKHDRRRWLTEWYINRYLCLRLAHLGCKWKVISNIAEGFYQMDLATCVLYSFACSSAQLCTACPGYWSSLFPPSLCSSRYASPCFPCKGTNCKGTNCLSTFRQRSRTRCLYRQRLHGCDSQQLRYIRP
jgi:hypothetical protein